MRVLVTDESKPVRGIIAKIFRDLGHDVTEAGNGKEAIALMKADGCPDLLTTSRQMPEMDGIELISSVRRSVLMRRLPVIMISVEQEPEQIQLALDAGADAYLAKPCSRVSITNTLEKMNLISAVKNVKDPSEGSTPIPGEKIRLLIVDDSVVVRNVVSKIIDSYPDLEVVGMAPDGQMALHQIEKLKPEVVLLDVEMPVKDGIETLQEIRPLPDPPIVIMFSSLTERGAAVTTKALLQGAKDFVRKPGGTEMKNREAGEQVIREELVSRIRAIALHHRKKTARDIIPVSTKPAAARTGNSNVEIVVMALSTGGPRALDRVIPDIGNVSVPVVIVQHMPPVFTEHLAKHLARSTSLQVVEAADGQPLHAGQFYIAPGGHHIKVHRENGEAKIQLTQEAPVLSCRPAADYLFESAAKAYGAGVLAVVMTGMGSDAFAGSKHVHDQGGKIIVQDEESSVVWGMPGQIAQAGLADAVVPLARIGNEVATRVN